MEILMFLSGPFLGILGFVLFILYITKQRKLEREFKLEVERELELRNKGKTK